MTGFGLGHYEDKSISIDVEIRSFNSRYFELQTRYFDLSSETEYKIRKFLKDNLKRALLAKDNAAVVKAQEQLAQIAINQQRLKEAEKLLSQKEEVVDSPKEPEKPAYQKPDP